MDFTREPIIETIVTPKEGYKLVVRSSKGTAQEEYFVDAVEVVSFGHALFFRSLERPKSFLVPVADYEILEVREARMVLKNVGLDRSIKIGGGREAAAVKASRETEKEAVAVEEESEPALEQEKAAAPASGEAAVGEAKPEVRLDKKRDRRRHYRKRRGAKGEEREEANKEEAVAVEPNIPPLEDEKINIPPPEEGVETAQGAPLSSSLLSSLLQPPPTLISETINRYRENALFKNAFFLTEEEQYKPHDKVQELLNEDDEEDFAPSLKEPSYLSEEGKPAESAEVSSVKEENHPEEELKSEILEEPVDEGEGIETEWQEPYYAEEQVGATIEEETSLPLYAEEESPVVEQAFKEEKQQQDEFTVPEDKQEEHSHPPSHNS